MGTDCRKRHENETEMLHRCSKHMLKKGSSYGRISTIKYNKLNKYVTACELYARNFIATILELGYEDFCVDFSSEMKLPKMIRYSHFNDKISSSLSGRTKNQIVKQVQPVLINWIKEWNYWFKKSATNETVDLDKWKKLPEINTFELTTTFCNVNINGNEAFLELEAMGDFGIKHWSSSVLRIPFKIDKRTVDNRIKSGWKLCSAVTVTRDKIILNWEKESILRKNNKPHDFIEGQAGCDQGISSVVTLAYKKGEEIRYFQSPLKNKHGWGLSKIIKRMGRAKKGSKQYARYQKLRANFIRWSINMAETFIKDNNLKVISLEDVRFMGRGKNCGQFLNKFEHSLIRSKLTMVSEENGVFLKLSSNAYRSQRCSACGFVHKLNRKNGTKRFVCVSCGHAVDADLNAALNHSFNLEPKKFGQLNNEIGEFWKEVGSQLGVDLVPNDPEPLIYSPLCG